MPSRKPPEPGYGRTGGLFCTCRQCGLNVTAGNEEELIGMVMRHLNQAHQRRLDRPHVAQLVRKQARQLV